MKIKTVRKCKKCGELYERGYSTWYSSKRFSRCPGCFGYESFVDVGGTIKYTKTSAYWESHADWWNPFSWRKGEWVEMNASVQEINELQRIASL